MEIYTIIYPSKPPAKTEKGEPHKNNGQNHKSAARGAQSAHGTAAPARRKERMTMEELTASMIQNGFSVAVAAYLLIRMDKRLEELTKAVTDLGAVMEKTSARHE